MTTKKLFKKKPRIACIQITISYDIFPWDWYFNGYIKWSIQPHVSDKIVTNRMMDSSLGSDVLQKYGLLNEEIFPPTQNQSFKSLPPVKPKRKTFQTPQIVPDDPINYLVSNNMVDACKTECCLCGKRFFLSQMRSHTLAKHYLQITKYKEIYGQFEIIEKVFHKCHLCGRLVQLDSDTLGGHIKSTHKMKEKEYKDKYINRVHFKNKILKKIKNEEIVAINNKEDEPDLSSVLKDEYNDNKELSYVDTEDKELFELMKNVDDVLARYGCFDLSTNTFRIRL